MDLGDRVNYFKALYFFLTKHDDARVPNVSDSFFGAIKDEFVKTAKLNKEYDMPVLALSAAGQIYFKVSHQSSRDDLAANDCDTLATFFRNSRKLFESEWNINLSDAANEEIFVRK